MESIALEKQHLRSCEILFGPETVISREFLDYLQLSGLKAAYRKRAMETHPDRVFEAQRHVYRQTNDSFHAVNEAYMNLRLFLESKNTTWRKQDGVAEENGATWTKGGHNHHFRQALRPIIIPPDKKREKIFENTERLYQGPEPYRTLLFGHFLYYSGLTNWRTITRVLFWQKADRPIFGELGCRFGIFSQEDITRILRNKKPFQLFGQTARELGIITECQLKELIVRQQGLKKKFGRILLEKNLVNRYELQELLSQFERHNANILTQ
jgi:hypothetical protein